MHDIKTNLRALALSASALSLGGLTGCLETDAPPEQDELASERDDEIDETDEIVDHLLAAGMPESEIAVEADGAVLLGGDVYVSLEAAREMAGAQAIPEEDGTTFRQYRSHNLMDPAIELICVVETNPFTGVFSSALDGAIQRYNDLGLSFTLQRGLSADCDASIEMFLWFGSGGQAEDFPAGGEICEWIMLGFGVSDVGEDATRHMIMPGRHRRSLRDGQPGRGLGPRAAGRRALGVP